MTYLLDSNACIGWLRQSQPKLKAKKAKRRKNGDAADAARFQNPKSCSLPNAQLQEPRTYFLECSTMAHRNGILLVLLMSSVAMTQEDEAGTELNKFQGVWKLVSREIDGKAVSVESDEALSFEIKNNQMTMKIGNEVKMQASIKIDIKKTPRHFDLYLEDEDDKGKKMMHVYELDGQTLTIACLTDKRAFEKRPEVFPKQATKGIDRLVLRKLGS